MAETVVRDEIVTTRVVDTVGPVDRVPLGEGFGWFIRIRSRGRQAAERRERSKYGTCVICRSEFSDDDRVHMVFSVVRNGKTVGNRLCCSSCAATHGTFHSRVTQPVTVESEEVAPDA